MNITTDYQQQAIDFLQSTNCKFSATYLNPAKYFDTDKEERDIYNIELKRGNRSFTFTFGQSLSNSGFYYTKGKLKVNIDIKYLSQDFKGKALRLAGIIKLNDYEFLKNGTTDIIHYPVAPNEYDVLACLTKYDIGTFENFCSDFGYDTDSKKAEKMYKATKNEYSQLCALFSDEELERLHEIQ